MCMYSLARNTYLFSADFFVFLFLSNSTILLGIKGLISTFFLVAITSLMLVYNELVILMEMVFVFSINSVLNIPYINLR